MTHYYAMRTTGYSVIPHSVEYLDDEKPVPDQVRDRMG